MNPKKISGESAKPRQQNTAGKIHLSRKKYKCFGNVYFKIKYGTDV